MNGVLLHAMVKISLHTFSLLTMHTNYTHHTHTRTCTHTHMHTHAHTRTPHTHTHTHTHTHMHSHTHTLHAPQSQPDSLTRVKDQPDPPRRAKSTPIPNTHILPAKHLVHLPPPSSSSSNPPSRHSESPNMPQKFVSLPPTVKKSLTTTPQPPQQLDPIKQKLVDRAIKARLYLLRQSGPTRFLVGGDAPDSRFHITIGPQVGFMTSFWCCMCSSQETITGFPRVHTCTELQL